MHMIKKNLNFKTVVDGGIKQNKALCFLKLQGFLATGRQSNT